MLKTLGITVITPFQLLKKTVYLTSLKSVTKMSL